MNSKTMRIPFAFSPTVKAILDDGSTKEFTIIGSRAYNILLAKNMSENRVYDLQVVKAGFPNELTFEVVGTSSGFDVVVDNDATAVTAVSNSGSAVVGYGETATFTLTFADGKSASDITVTGGTVSGTTLTVANVTDDVSVTIADKD